MDVNLVLPALKITFQPSLIKYLLRQQINFPIMVVRHAPFIQQNSREVDDQLKDVDWQSLPEDEFPVVHVEELYYDLDGAAFVELVLLGEEELLEEEATFLAVDDPVALQSPNVDGEVLVVFLFFIFFHDVFEVEVICVA